MLGVGVVAPEAGVIPLLQQPTTPDQPRDFSAWYCNLPFADFFSACKVPTLTELEAEHQRELSRIAAVNPDLAAQAFAQGQQLTAADCAANPEACAEFTFAGQNPTAAAILGAGPGSRTIYQSGASLFDFSTATPWILLAAVGALLLTRR